MKHKLDPELEERERLEQFLKWRRAVGRSRRASDRRFLFFFVGTVLGVVAGVLIVTLVRASLDSPTRLVSDPTRTAAKDVATLSRDSRSPAPPNPPAVGDSARRGPSASMGGAEAAAIEAAPAEERPPMGPRRPARIEPRASRPPRHPTEARALPQRSPSQRPQLPENPAPLPYVTAAASPSPVQPPHDATGTPGEPVATASSPASFPALSTATPAMPAVPGPDMAKDVTVVAVPPPVQATPDAAGTQRESVSAAAFSPASSPTLSIATPAMPPVSEPEITKDTRSETMETVKRLIGYIPEVRLGKAIVRWVKSQPPADPGSRPLKSEFPQAR
jgi:hypothetical protein